MKSSLRKGLADSHISAVATAVLLVWSLESVFRASYWILGTAILYMPYLSVTFGFAGRPNPVERLNLIVTFSYLFRALSSFAAAWLLSHWVYGEGPFHRLTKYRTSLERRSHV